MHAAIKTIKVELEERLVCRAGGANLEAQAAKALRTTFDIEMMVKIGLCSGMNGGTIQSHIDQRQPGEGTPSDRLLPDDFPVVIDERVTAPSDRGASACRVGDSRKRTVEHGFRLPKGSTNRPPEAERIPQRVGQKVYLLGGHRKYAWALPTAWSRADPLRPVSMTWKSSSSRRRLDRRPRSKRSAGARINERAVTTLTRAKMAENSPQEFSVRPGPVRYSLMSTILRRVELIHGTPPGLFNTTCSSASARERA
jgi:excinuclease ABC subunit B